VAWWIGVAAVVGTLLTSYLGVQAQAVGVGRYYGGILGRADRLVIIMLASIFYFLY
jgi:CDP-diacylglycerol--glycerol-3-phosphate 3-phosphatidyltransferase/archaetidylinositol phosphate synthase